MRYGQIKLVFGITLQGDSGGCLPGLTLILLFHHVAECGMLTCPASFAKLPSAWAESGQTVEHQNPSPPNPGRRPPESPCNPVPHSGNLILIGNMGCVFVKGIVVLAHVKQVEVDLK